MVKDKTVVAGYPSDFALRASPYPATSLIRDESSECVEEGEILCRDRACPCPNSKEDSHKGCPYGCNTFGQH